MKTFAVETNLFYCYVFAQELPSHTFAIAMSPYQIIPLDCSIDILPKGLETPHQCRCWVCYSDARAEVLMVYTWFTQHLCINTAKKQYSMVPIGSSDNYSEYSWRASVNAVKPTYRLTAVWLVDSHIWACVPGNRSTTVEKWRTSARSKDRQFEWYQGRSSSEFAWIANWFEMKTPPGRHLVSLWSPERLQSHCLYTSTRHKVHSNWLLRS